MLLLEELISKIWEVAEVHSIKVKAWETLEKFGIKNDKKKYSKP